MRHEAIRAAFRWPGSPQWAKILIKRVAENDPEGFLRDKAQRLLDELN